MFYFVCFLFKIWGQSGDTSVQLKVKKGSLHLQITDVISVNSLLEQDA